MQVHDDVSQVRSQRNICVVVLGVDELDPLTREIQGHLGHGAHPSEHRLLRRTTGRLSETEAWRS